jgi:predicted dehydrogenase
LEKINIGIVGCGNIARTYVENIINRFSILELHGVFDRDIDVANSVLEGYSTRKVYSSYEELLQDKNIQIVLNLTPPLVHYETTSMALQSGKHVYSEKPLGVNFREALELSKLATEKNLFLAVSPDTFLGGGLQSCRKYLDEGVIGDILGCSAFLIKPGVESWHPNPNFLYQEGAGPLLDTGVYYLTALVSLLGGIETVAGMNRISFPTRTITSQPRFGQLIDVTVPTYVNGLLRFRTGALGVLTTAFDIQASQLPFIEIYGSKGTMSVPNPDAFGGKVEILHHGSDPEELPVVFGYTENSRGLGLADMAQAILTGRAARADHHLALHITETMDAIIESNEREQFIHLTTDCNRPNPIEQGYIY